MYQEPVPGACVFILMSMTSVCRINASIVFLTAHAYGLAPSVKAVCRCVILGRY